MFAYFESLSEWLEALIWVSVIAGSLGVITGMVYRLIKYGVKIKVGVVEVDASDENDPKPEHKPDMN